MDFLKFRDVRFAYQPVEDDVDEDGKQIIPPVIFDNFSADLPGGFVSLVGPNGSGKSTFMLLAAGRILPENGSVSLLGHDTASISEEERDILASYIYQNMELETEEKVSVLLDFVYKNGKHKGNAPAIREESGDFMEEIKSVFELESSMEKKLCALSKSEMQRVLLAFSLLYGSLSIFMDEPLFALEEPQKEKALAYLRDFCKKTGVSVYISMHELDLTKKYAETVLLFYPNHDIDLGTVEEVLTNEDLEKAYGVPAAMLKHSEIITRENIKAKDELVRKVNDIASSVD